MNIVLKNRVERRLVDTAERLRVLQEELSIHSEQLAQLIDEAEDARLRALVSETPIAVQEHRVAQRHAEAFGRRQDEIVHEIARLQVRQDELLDALTAQPSQA